MMTFVTENIALGNSFDATDWEQLDAYGITGVLNVAVDLDLVLTSRPVARTRFNVEYQKVGLWDGPGNPPGALAAAVLMLDAMLQRHRRVLVHCHAGISRSPVVVATYLAHRRRIPFSLALEEVQRCHSLASPHPLLCSLAGSLPNVFDAFPAEAVRP